MKIHVEPIITKLGNLHFGDTFEYNSQFYIIIDCVFDKPTPNNCTVANLNTGDVVSYRNSTEVVKVDLEVRKVERET